MTGRYFIGVDVGTASARAGVFDAAGGMLASASHPFAVHLETGDRAEQSSTEIWNAVCICVRQAVASAGISPDAVGGIGFDATCSLVVLGENGRPLSISDSGEERDIIVWMDHRAIEQAERINATGHPILQFVGGNISPEMQTPKLLWLAENKPKVFADAWQFFDLPDFLTWKATDSLERSVCTVTCKWTYLAHEERWDADYFSTIGLGSLAEEGFARIGTEILAPGAPVGNGLSERAARDLGLPKGIAVSASLIDAHAGGVGTVGAGGGLGATETRMAYVFGTSACTMSSSREAHSVSGVWGPYYSAMVPGLWLTEGGQSAAGAALDHLVTHHPATPEAAREAEAAGQTLVGWLAGKAMDASASLSEAARLAGQVHVVPEFLGNRAPHADPHAKALIAGLGMGRDIESLVALYVAGVMGLGYGVRQIVEVASAAGVVTEAIVISGGAGKSPLIRQLLADCTGIPVLVTAATEPVLLGSAMLGAVAAGEFAALPEAMKAMSTIETTVTPDGGMRAFHDSRHSAFVDMQAVGRRIRGA